MTGVIPSEVSWENHIFVMIVIEGIIRRMKHIIRARASGARHASVEIVPIT